MFAHSAAPVAPDAAPSPRATTTNARAASRWPQASRSGSPRTIRPPIQHSTRMTNPTESRSPARNSETADIVPSRSEGWNRHVGNRVPVCRSAPHLERQGEARPVDRPGPLDPAAVVSDGAGEAGAERGTRKRKLAAAQLDRVRRQAELAVAGAVHVCPQRAVVVLGQLQADRDAVVAARVQLAVEARGLAPVRDRLGEGRLRRVGGLGVRSWRPGCPWADGRPGLPRGSRRSRRRSAASRAGTGRHARACGCRSGAGARPTPAPMPPPRPIPAAASSGRSPSCAGSPWRDRGARPGRCRHE